MMHTIQIQKSCTIQFQRALYGAKDGENRIETSAVNSHGFP